MRGVLKPNALLDFIKGDKSIRSDWRLSLELDINVSIISKYRNGKIGLHPSLILAIHETYGYPVTQIRELHLQQLLLDSGKREQNGNVEKNA